MQLTRGRSRLPGKTLCADRVAKGAGPAGGRTRSASAAEAGRGGEGAEGSEEEEVARGEDERDAYSDAKEAEGTDDSGGFPGTTIKAALR